MAFTQITDVIVPEVYETYTPEDLPEKTAFFQSGVVIRNEMLNASALEGGNTINLPFWKDLDPTVAPNLSDDTTTLAVPNKITAGK